MLCLLMHEPRQKTLCNVPLGLLKSASLRIPLSAAQPAAPDGVHEESVLVVHAVLLRSSSQKPGNLMGNWPSRISKQPLCRMDFGNLEV